MLNRLIREKKLLEAECERLRAQCDAILLQARCWAGEAKAQQSITREVGAALGGIPTWGPIAAGVEAMRAERDALAAELAAIKGQEPDCDRSACGDFSPGRCDNPDCSARRDRKPALPAAPEGGEV